MKYNDFLNEMGKGISNAIKIHTERIFNEIQKNGFDGEIFAYDSELPDMPLINLGVSVSLTHRNYGKFDTTYIQIKDNKIYDALISIEIDKNNISNVKLKEIITHELTHMLEYYKIKSKEVNLDVKANVTPTYVSVRNSINEIKFDNGLNEFKSLIYLALESEYNARIAQLYQFLKSFNSKDPDFLYEKLLLSESYGVFVKLDSFNPESFLNNLYDKIGKSATISELNRLNVIFLHKGVNKLKSYTFIKLVDEKNILNYLNNWKKLFKDKNVKYIQRMKRMIEEVVNPDTLKESYMGIDIDLT